MAKNKISVKKNCPFCGCQVAVASKNCPNCKHSFYEAKQKSLGLLNNCQSSSTSEDTPSGSSRRTSRIKREKPNYYDASEFEKKTKKKRTVTGNPRGRPPNNPQTQGLKTKKKKKHNKVARDVEEDDEPIVLNAEKQLQCSIILAELNRKFVGTTFRV
uniref:Uncharacterized protein n=1 Tax=Cuerna arida TaxID=1464854 RepID=A0A1B6G922_9HEMI